MNFDIFHHGFLMGSNGNIIMLQDKWGEHHFCLQYCFLLQLAFIKWHGSLQAASNDASREWCFDSSKLVFFSCVYLPALREGPLKTQCVPPQCAPASVYRLIFRRWLSHVWDRLLGHIDNKSSTRGLFTRKQIVSMAMTKPRCSNFLHCRSIKKWEGSVLVY